MKGSRLSQAYMGPYKARFDSNPLNDEGAPFASVQLQ